MILYRNEDEEKIARGVADKLAQYALQLDGTCVFISSLRILLRLISCYEALGNTALASERRNTSLMSWGLTRSNS